MIEELQVGVLALQGAVEEHITCLKALGCAAREVKRPAELDGLDGLILPGGESTAMAILGERNGIFQQMRDWVKASKPVWGTCAGMILLSDHAIKQAEGGQSLLGGLDAIVCRNYFGSQIQSCEKTIDTKLDGFSDCKGVFIRAPAILKTGPGVQILGIVRADPHRSVQDEVTSVVLAANNSEDGAFISSVTTNSDGDEKPQRTVAVAVRQGNIIATAFHPELTNDLRWHRYFLEMVRADKVKRSST